MSELIPISSNPLDIYLQAGFYSVKIVGGWHVGINDFSFVLKEESISFEIKPTSMKFGSQSFVNGIKSKTVFEISIPWTSTYRIEFLNHTNLIVKPFYFPLIHKFQKPVPSSQLKLCIGK